MVEYGRKDEMMYFKFEHVPVMAREVIEGLNIQPDGIYVDGTLGGGGHSALILEKLSDEGRLIGIDQDLEAIAAAKENLAKYGGKVVFVNDNFANLGQVLDGLDIGKVDGILLDLGVSSYQLDNIKRGFSFRETEENLKQPLDMRMDLSQDFSAYEVVNRYSEEKLKEIFFRLGEEPFSRVIAARIIEARKNGDIETIGELVEIIKKAMPPKYRFSKGGGGNYASKVFRALRMEVNDELGVVDEVIPQAIKSLESGGRLVVITFHSLEDRLVKHSFRNLAQADSPTIKLISKKAIKPTEEEIAENSRAASAKVRVVEKLY